VINEVASLVPSHVHFELFNALADISAFDGRDEDPESVKNFKSKVKEADGVLICTPEYAFGVPGAFKNALDWTVGSSDFYDKPVALITALPWTGNNSCVSMSSSTTPVTLCSSFF